MDHIAAVEERIVSERITQKINQVNTAAQTQLSGVQDHIFFTLQQAYFKCAHECFDRTKKKEEIENCVEYCSVPVLNAQNFVENEMANFQVVGGSDHHNVLAKNVLSFMNAILGEKWVMKMVYGIKVHLYDGKLLQSPDMDLVLGRCKMKSDVFFVHPMALEKMNRSLMVCQDKFKTATQQKNKSDAIKDMESCVDQSVQESLNSLPHLVGKFKVSLGITD
ncbi:putative 2-isopropylmalate synthase A-like [Capsicum annuum]|nr:putative 2-isopropylmalate synthase A-like [Capsicum annuum]